VHHTNATHGNTSDHVIDNTIDHVIDNARDATDAIDEEI
jgi:hypothetical protein